MSVTNSTSQRYVSSRDLSEELTMLKDTIDTFVYGNSGSGKTSPAAHEGCATHTFANDRAALFMLSEQLRSGLKTVMFASTVGSQPSPPRRALSPTNNTSALELGAIHPAGLAVNSATATVLIATRGSSRSPVTSSLPPAPSSINIVQVSPRTQQSTASESLNEIAARYCVPLSEIRAHNPKLSMYTDSEKLPPSSAVRIPTYAAPAAAARGNASPLSPRSLIGVAPLNAGGVSPAITNYISQSPSSPSFGDVGYVSATATPQRYVSSPRNASPLHSATPFSTNAAAPYNAPVDRALESSLPAAPHMSPMVMNQSAGTINGNGSFSGSLALLQSEQPQRQTQDCDSLWSLAKEYDIPVRELLRANPQLRNFGVNEMLPPQLVVAIPIVN